MANYIQRIRTESGDLQIDYKALANLPQPDPTLSKEGSFADAKAIGDKINLIFDELTSQGSSIPTSVIKSVNGVKPDVSGNVVLKASDVDALPSTYTHVKSIGGQTGDVALISGAGISVENTTITNTGVRSVTTGSSNGTISVNANGSTSDVFVKGLGSAAYTNSDQYMPNFTFSLSGGTLYINT